MPSRKGNVRSRNGSSEHSASKVARKTVRRSDGWMEEVVKTVPSDVSVSQMTYEEFKGWWRQTFGSVPLNDRAYVRPIYETAFLMDRANSTAIPMRVFRSEPELAEMDEDEAIKRIYEMERFRAEKPFRSVPPRKEVKTEAGSPEAPELERLFGPMRPIQKKRVSRGEIYE